MDVQEKPTTSFQVALRLIRFTTQGEGGRIALGLVTILSSTLIGLLQPWPMKLVLDSVISKASAPWGLDALGKWINPSNPSMGLLLVLCVGQLLIYLVSGALLVWSTWVLVSIGLRMVFKLRCALFSHIQRLSLRFHDQTTIGDSLYRVTWDSYCVQSIFNTGLIPALIAITTLIGITGIMLCRDLLVTVIALGVGIPLAILVKWMERPMTEGSMRVQERESEISTRVQETLTGIRAVQAFGGEPREAARFQEHAMKSLQASLKLTVMQTASQSVVGVIMAGGTALIVAISAWRVLNGRLLAGDVWMIVSYVAMLFKPLETLVYTASLIQGSIAGARRCFVLLDTQPDVKDEPGAVELSKRAEGNIELCGVRFGYGDGRYALDGVDLKVGRGQTVALVGPSGAGKTTLISLLMRFYDPVEGKILLDGRDLKTMTLRSLRANMSLVLQDPVLFCSSVAENISYGRPEATMDQIIDAAKQADAHNFIMEMPHKYETHIGERGATLSGGQKQRMAIARAFLKDAPVLIMDEPTSALDAGTERHLLDAMERLRKNRTTLIIAHRLSTIRSADVIVAMESGKAVEMGSHDELLKRGGLYSRLYQMQFQEKETPKPS